MWRLGIHVLARDLPPTLRGVRLNLVALLGGHLNQVVAVSDIRPNLAVRLGARLFRIRHLRAMKAARAAIIDNSA